ncbi:MAG: FlgD immunoglobulin-like domain containing protein [Gemmatimonadota bacterium]|jgi:hypothetical protein|nr:hypothetical protein [Gemmatimonadota bacterium]MDP6802012.1 FlgD immunoglobulin-like domain containing protein [Gemmatimonadota bacterium]MDP7031360.1 FlgD immunoglobulin-like domain containing protein [Gemmatimonadota bacterium]
MMRLPPVFASARSFSTLAPWLLALLFVTCALLPVSASAVSIRTDGLLEVDGEPFYPLGLVELATYRYEDWNDRIRRSRANIVWDIEIAYADTTPSCADIADSAAATGYYIMLGSGDTWNWDDLSTPELEVDQNMYEPALLDAAVQCLDSRGVGPLVVANRDEPVWTLSRNKLGDIDRAHIYDTYDQLKSVLPDRPVAMNFAPVHLSGDRDLWKADVSTYMDATDIVMYAAYPFPGGEGTCSSYNVIDFPACRLDRLPVTADIFLGELNQAGQPLWVIVQAFKNIPLKEARWQAYTSVVHGATGIFWAGWSWTHFLGGGPPTWPVVEQVMGEVSDLYDVLLSEDEAGAWSEEPAVEVRAKRGPDGMVTLFAVARNGFVGSARIHLPNAGVGGVTVLNEDRTLPMSNRTLVDDFDGYEAHVYRYRARMSSQGGSTSVPDGVLFPADRFRMVVAPNPATGPARARFHLPRAGTVLFTVYDASGRRVAVPGRGSFAAGEGEFYWNGRDFSGQPVSPGVYFLSGRTSAGEEATARIVLRR